MKDLDDLRILVGRFIPSVGSFAGLCRGAQPGAASEAGLAEAPDGY